MATSSEDRSYPRPFSVTDLDPDLPDDLVWGFLIWLPVKSLMRFKCVSKLWQSIILNPSFARAYRGGFRGVLIDEPSFWRFSQTKDFFCLNLFDDEEEIVRGDNGLNCMTSSAVKFLSHNHTVDHGSGRKFGSTDIVNGLVCFYNGNYSCLYNIATRETLELPLSQYDNKSCSYHLGFDPVNKLYKLLKICPNYNVEEEYFTEQSVNAIFFPNLDCEILTLGIDKSWRNIDAAPWEIFCRSVCFDGVLYWKEPMIDDDLDKCLIAFHLAQEKFESVSIPDNIYYLPRFAPGLALMAICPRRVGVILYGKGGGWGDEQKFKLPEEPAIGSDPRGILPDGMVLIPCHGSIAKMDCLFVCYLYDPMEKKFTRNVIRQCPSSPSEKFRGRIEGYMSYFEENIIPLSCVLTKASSSSRPYIN